MTTGQHGRRAAPVLSIKIAEEQDVVTARQRARQLADLLGFDSQDQVRIATSVSEITRNVLQYAVEGRLVFSIDLHSQPQYFCVTVSDKGPGIAALDSIITGAYESPNGMGIGLTGTRRLMPLFEIESKPGEGTTVRFGKPIPGGRVPLLSSDLGALCQRLSQQRTAGAADELQRQNSDLLQTLEVLRQRETELEKRQQELSRLNVELEETNRGVVALYAELDEKAAALRHADEMKSRFLWHVSHEFRTPLNSIQALSRLLLGHADGPLSAEQEKQVGYIRQAAGELTEMVNDLLDLAKVEAGKAEVRMTRVDAGQLLGSVRALMRPLATNEAVRLIFDEPPAGLWMRTDEGKVSQILRNIISNALKFTESGAVKVAASLAPHGEEISFAVEDTGIGIAPENLARIFQEFAQIESPMQRTVKGTGLGLPLSRKLAELLNGTLIVKSRLGVGSEFVLTLPRNLRREERESAQGANGRTPQSILLIDDDERSRYVTRQMFAGTRHDILEASGGVEGSERARFELPALIVLDLAMPDQSGFVVLEELKANPATRDIPVVIQTSIKLSEADRDRISERALTILPKEDLDRRQALLKIREALGEADLFANEREFANGKGAS
jgi:signal transduction histidine kinase/CheY-like chemotaxis protein